MRRVVVTGTGHRLQHRQQQAQVADSLREGRSGIEFSEEYRELGFRSHVHGPLRHRRRGADRPQAAALHGRCGGLCTSSAMNEAIADSGLTEARGLEPAHRPDRRLRRRLDGQHCCWPADTLREKGRHAASARTWCRAPCRAPIPPAWRTPFKIKGVNYSISSACATSAHCIGNAAELIQFGKQDIVFAGGGEELHWTDRCCSTPWARCRPSTTTRPRRLARL